MRIAVIGTGRIGGTLARRWAEAGHTIVLGARDPAGEKASGLLGELGAACSATDPASAVAAAEVVLLAVPSGAAAETLRSIGGSIGERIVIDATNAISSPTVNALATIRAAAPRARLARAFNSLGWENFANPMYGDERATMFYVAEDAADAITAELIAEIGLEPVRVGGMDQVELVDNLLRLWLILARGPNGRNVAFRLLRR